MNPGSGGGRYLGLTLTLTRVCLAEGLTIIGTCLTRPSPTVCIQPGSALQERSFRIRAAPARVAPPVVRLSRVNPNRCYSTA